MATELIRDPFAPVLKKEAAPVTDFGPDLRLLVAAMEKVMADHNGAGLAAPQVGESLRVFILPKNYGPRQVYVNPTIDVPRDGMKVEVEMEGCLSIPDYTFPIARWKKIRVQAVGLDGEPFAAILRGKPARAAQHELDHLNGILITDERAGVTPVQFKPAMDADRKVAA